jgi:hypothetical protein
MKWWSVPKIIDENYQDLSGSENKKIIPTYKGLIIQNPNGAKLFDISSNEIFDVSTSLLGTIQGIAAKYPNSFNIQKDSALYIYEPKNDSLIQVSITKDQFITTGKKLFQDIPSKASIDWNKILLLLSLVIITSTGVIIIIKQKRKAASLNSQLEFIKQEYAKAQEVKINNDGTFSSNLTEKELSVFQFLMDKTIINQPTSIDDINTILGVKNKDLTIQNQLRSDVFQNINKKFKVYATTNDTLIERERTEFDKRVYQYRINERYINKIK